VYKEDGTEQGVFTMCYMACWTGQILCLGHGCGPSVCPSVVVDCRGSLSACQLWRDVSLVVHAASERPASHNA